MRTKLHASWVAEAVCTWRSRDQPNAVLRCSAHSTDEVTVTSGPDGKLSVWEGPLPPTPSPATSYHRCGKITAAQTPRAQRVVGSGPFQNEQPATHCVLQDKMPRERIIWSKVVFVQEQFTARVLWLLFWQEGKVKNTSRKKKKKKKREKRTRKRQPKKAGSVHFGRRMCEFYSFLGGSFHQPIFIASWIARGYRRMERTEGTT